jgi:hypothetical protein
VRQYKHQDVHLLLQGLRNEAVSAVDGEQDVGRQSAMLLFASIKRL